MIDAGITPVGLAEREISRLFADRGGREAAGTWAREVLAAAELDPRRKPLRSVRVLRRAERRLSPIGARYLVEVAAGRIPSRSTRRSQILM